MHTRDFGGEVVHGNIFADYYDLFAVEIDTEKISLFVIGGNTCICDLSILSATTSVQVSVFITNNVCINHI